MIAIVKYNAGNLGSVANALDRLGQKYKITAVPNEIKAADGVIFPGQGRAGPAMASLRENGLDSLLPELPQPFLGICLGMQLMVDELEEDKQQGLGIIPGKCQLIKGVKPVPHMGWNTLSIAKQSQLLEGLSDGSFVYFVHSYAVHVPDEFVIARTDYGGDFDSVIAKDNFYGTQFHPEKSAETGQQILKKFLKICGENK
jgi:glutamine amidotransferase